MSRIFSKWTAVGLIVLTAVIMTAVATAAKKATYQVCVLLPDTSSSVRWVQFDAPDMAAAFRKAGVTASITNALNDAQKQKAQAAACLAAGAKVVIETMLDPGSAVAIEKSFTSKGGKAIDYDRLVPNGPASAYVTFDGNKVGRAQATGVLAALKGQDEAGRRRALGQPDRHERGLVQERKRRHPEPAVQEREDRQGPAAVRARLVGQRRSERRLRADAREDEQQDRRGDRGERQHRRRRGRAAEGQAPEADPAQRAGRDRRRCAVHHLRLADGNGLQAGAPAGGRRGRGCDRAPQGQADS